MSRVPSFPYVIAFVIGIAISYFTLLDDVVLLVTFTLLTIVSFVVYRYKRWRVIPPALAFAVVGVFFMQHSKARFDIPIPKGYNSFTAILTDIPQQKKSGLASEFYVLDGDMAGQYVRLYVKNDSASLHFRGNEIAPVVPELGCTYHIRSRMKAFEGNNSYTFWARSHSYLAQGWVYPQNIKPVEATCSLPTNVRLPLKARILRSTLLLQLFPPSESDEESLAILAAMAFGDKSLVTAELRDSYSVSGASHLLALSGMHLGILYALLMLFFGRTNPESLYRNGRWRDVVSLWQFFKQVTIIAVIWLYVLITGMPASVVRAATMITIYAIANAGNPREHMSLNALLITIFVMLAINPLMLWDIGFQMSALAMLSIFILYPRMRSLVNIRRYPIVCKVIDIILVSVAAQIGTAPLAMFYFERFSLAFIITNIIAIPLVAIILYCVFAYVVLFCLLKTSAITFPTTIIVSVIYFFARCLNTYMNHIASLGLSLEGIKINIYQLPLIYLALLIIYIICTRLKKMFLCFS